MADSKNYIPINQTTFPQTKEGDYPLGDNCHQQVNGAIPVWVLTDMLGKIIVGNSFYLDAKMIPTYSHTDKVGWCVTRGRITINRSYQASTATVTLSSTRHNMDDVMPSLPKDVARFTLTDDGHPNVDYLAATDTRHLDKGDVVCIWAGYIPELRAVTSDDLDKGLLIRRFVGKIDTLVGLSTFNQGEQVVINMRDFMAYLMDSMGTYNVSDFNPIGTASEDQNKPDIEVNQSIVNRPRVILELARRCIGHLEFAESLSDSSYSLYCSSVGGMKINQGYVVDYSDDSKHPDSIYEVYKNSNNPLTKDELAPDQMGPAAPFVVTPFIGGKTRTGSKSLPMGNHLRMNIVSGRAPFVLGADNKNWLGDHFQITDRVPVEFIKMLSLQEPWPTEFFVDSRTGEYWYAPRGTDLTGLSDPKRFYRTYCVRRQPVDLLKKLAASSNSNTSIMNLSKDTIHLCQAALLFREESSVINFRTNVIVSSQPLASNPGGAIGVHVAVHPSWLSKTRFACSYFQAVDSTIGKNTSELVATAMSYARYYGKELRAASLHVLGDPSIVPGEAIQVIGSTLYGGGYEEIVDQESSTQAKLPAWEWDRKVISSYLDGYDQLGINQRNAAKNDTPGSREEAKKAAAEALKVDKGIKTQIANSSAGVEIVEEATFKQMTQAQLMCPYAITGIKEAEIAKQTQAAKQAQVNPYSNNSSVTSDFALSAGRKTSPTDTPATATSAITQASSYIGADASSNTINFPEDPKTIWRVEAIIEKLYENPGEGYKTEIALISPF